MRELQSDPEYVARTQQQERLRQLGIEAYRQAVEPVMRELAESGIQCGSLSELRQSGAEYRSAVPILLDWLPQVENVAVKEDIVRTLSVPWARPIAAPVLIEEFRRVREPQGDQLRWAIASALAVVADDSVFSEIVDLVRNRRNGKAREMLTLSLANMKESSAIVVLLALLDDEQTVGHAVMALGMLRAFGARERLVALTRHSKAWVREEARKALLRL